MNTMDSLEAIPNIVTVREVLALDPLKGAEILGGTDYLDRPLLNVQFASEGVTGSEIWRDSILVVDASRTHTDSYLIDIVLKQAHDAGASGVILANAQQPISTAPRRLADRFELPLINVTADPFMIVDEIREVAVHPTRFFADILVRAAATLTATGGSNTVEKTLGIIDEILGAHSVIMSPTGEVLVGDTLPLTEVSFQQTTTFSVLKLQNHIVRVIHPISVAPGEYPSFWLVVEKSSPSDAWLRATEHILTIASQYIVVSMLTSRFETERDARHDLGILNSIISTEQVSPSLRQQVGILGWQVEGWCSAFDITVTGASPDQVTAPRPSAIGEALRKVGTQGPFIQHPNGWTSWVLSRNEPSPDAFREMTTALTNLFAPLADGANEIRLAVGLGRPHVGLSGLRRSLLEAHEATTIAQAEGKQFAIRHIDKLGIERVLYTWYSSPEFTNFSRSLLSPIMGLEGGELVRTLEIYLDCESSATLTAHLLGVHRNTILKRINRIKDLISVNLDDADQRLAIQLACRVVNINAHTS